MPELNFVATDAADPTGADGQVIQPYYATTKPGYNYSGVNDPSGDGFLEFGSGTPGSLPFRVDQAGNVTAASINSGSTFAVAPPTGTAADMTAIQAAISAASAAGSGTVLLQAGIYEVTSAVRTDASVSYTGSGSSYTWTDAAITGADIGDYLVGAGINGRSPQIVSVTPGVGFVTDIAPGGTVTSASMTFVISSLFLPDGVTLQGVGAPFGATPLTAGGTVIYDAGNGITVFMRGGNNINFYDGRSKIINLGLRGTPAIGQYGTNGTTAWAGAWVNNNDSFVEVIDCEFTGYTLGGLVMDYNINALDCRNTLFTYCGYATATVPTGGVVIQPYGNYASAGINFYNCWWWECHGFGIAGGGSSQGSLCVYSCQWNVIRTSSCYQSGTGAYCSGPNSVFVDCWGDGCSTYDIVVSYGYCTIVSGSYVSPCAYAFYSEAAGNTLNIIGVYTSDHTTAVVNNNGATINYQGNGVLDTTFIPGLVTGAQAAGSGTINGPAIETLTLPVNNAVTVTSNAGTCSAAYSLHTFTNSSAATMAITLATAGAVDGQPMTVRVYDFSAAAETIGWTNTENSSQSVPTTSNGSATLPKTVQFMFNGATSKWRCIMVS